MRSITGTLTTELERHVDGENVARADAFPVGSFRELVEHVAHLSYLNKDHLLFFRGQARDFRNKAGASTLYPTIYRGERVPKEQLDLSLSVLDSAASRLCDALEASGIPSHRDVRRRRYIQWSIIQHYEVCATPLLDLTHSLRVACSFAFMFAGDGDPYVMVLGLPYLTNRISVNSEHDLVNVRLLSICPPEALRPYFQEGYLAGTDEVLSDFDSKTELDFNNRLIAKFRLTGGRTGFWSGGFKPYPRNVLYPPHDRIQVLCEGLKTDVGVGLSAGHIGSFLEQWTNLEAMVKEIASTIPSRAPVYNLRAALDLLRAQSPGSSEIVERLHRLRKIRNEVVHRPREVSAADVATATREIREVLGELRTGLG